MLYSTQISRKTETDVLVAGGGLAGCAAAISAARHGVKVILIEETGCLGGQAGFGLVTPISAIAALDGKSFGGLVEEIAESVFEESNKYCVYNTDAKYQAVSAPHIFKYILLKLAVDAGVDVRFHTRLMDVVCDNDVVTEIITHDKSGYMSIKAKAFIDGSGDGDLLARANASYVLGSEPNVYDFLSENNLDVVHESDDKYVNTKEKVMQPVSIFFTLGNVDTEKAINYNNVQFKFGDLGITKEKFEQWKFANTCGFEITNDRIPTPQGRILITKGPVEGTVVVNMSRITGIDSTDADSLNEGEIKAQLQLIPIIDFLKTFIPGFENCYYIQSACSLGIRESRRLVGRYILTGGEAINATKSKDVIARGSYIIDIHDPLGKNKAIGGKIKGNYYDIPYGCLLSKEHQNLLACGRCISADHVAHSSTRIQGTCIMTGQAAGTAAALSVKKDITPSNINVTEVQSALIKDGVYID